MKTNYIPAIVMLLAGAVYCLVGISAQASLMDFTVQLFIVLLVFYILGGIVKMVLDKFMGKLEEKKEEDDAESTEETTEEQADAEVSENEEEI